MKKVILIFLSSILAISFVSCDAEDKINEALAGLAQFDFEANSDVDITVAPAGRITLEETVNTGINSELEKNNFDKENIGSIKFKDLKLTIPESSSLTFDIVESISISIKADGLALKEVVSVSSVSNQTKVLDLTAGVSKEDLIQYLLKDSITYEVTIETTEAITEAVKIDLDSIFTVTPKITL